MRKRRAFIGCILAFAALSGPLWGDEEPGTITLGRTEVFGGLTRAPVRFPHEAHWGIEGVDCLSCHHRYEGGKNTLETDSLMSADSPPRCASCHAGKARLQAAFHLECINYHDNAKRLGKPAGPRTCGDCHPWK